MVRVVCALREELVPRGWERSNDANLPLVVNGNGTVAISVATGDEETGMKEGAPCTSSAKGPKTALAILENLGQGVLFPSQDAAAGGNCERQRQGYVDSVDVSRQKGEAGPL